MFSACGVGRKGGAGTLLSPHRVARSRSRRRSRSRTTVTATGETGHDPGRRVTEGGPRDVPSRPLRQSWIISIGCALQLRYARAMGSTAGVTLPKLPTRPPNDVVQSWPESARRYVSGLERVLGHLVDSIRVEAGPFRRPSRREPSPVLRGPGSWPVSPYAVTVVRDRDRDRRRDRRASVHR
jgi:hypothetical protein